MAYIGIQPAESFTSFATQTFSVSATTSYTLDHAVANENEIALFVNNVRQQPGSGKAYTASGTALTLSAATASTDTMYCVFLGRALQTVTPSTNSITSSMLGSNFFTGATDVGGAIADADLFLMDDGAGGTLRKTAASRIKTYVGGGITVADQWRLTADTSISSSSLATIASNLERVDTTTQGYIGTAMSESSGIFTFPSTGVYLVMMNMVFKKAGSSQWLQTQIQVSNDSGSNYNIVSDQETSISQVSSATTSTSATMNSLVDVTDASTFRVRFQVAVAATTSLEGNTDKNYTYFTFIRLGDT